MESSEPGPYSQEEQRGNWFLREKKPGVYILVRKWYLSPPPSENDIFPFSRHIVFRLLPLPFCLNSFLVCINCTLLLPLFSFSFPFLPFSFPFLHFLSPFFIFFPLSSFFFYIFPLSFFPENDIGWYVFLPPGREGIFQYTPEKTRNK